MLEQVEQTGIEEKSAKTIDQYAQMLTFSFRIGQGTEPSQHNALRYAKSRHPDLIVTDDAFSSIKAATKNLIYPMFFPKGLPRYDTAITERDALH
jgi:hypothetical protein